SRSVPRVSLGAADSPWDSGMAAGARVCLQPFEDRALQPGVRGGEGRRDRGAARPGDPESDRGVELDSTESARIETGALANLHTPPRSSRVYGSRLRKAGSIGTQLHGISLCFVAARTLAARLLE